jgi:hypothetical protein
MRRTIFSYYSITEYIPLRDNQKKLQKHYFLKFKEWLLIGNFYHTAIKKISSFFLDDNNFHDLSCKKTAHKFKGHTKFTSQTHAKELIPMDLKSEPAK